MKVYYSNDTYSLNQLTKVVWTNGCYDLLHIGHIRLFEYCRHIAEKTGCDFFVGIDSDDRVKQLKGQTRPLNTEDDRAEMLLSIKGINRVYIYNTSEELISIIKNLTPEALVVGDEYKNKTVVGGSYAKNIIYFPKIPKYSSTKLIATKGGCNEDIQVE